MTSYYWSSTTNANNTDNAWNVNFNNGNVNNNNKSNTNYVRAVRGGKCDLLSFQSVFQAYLDCRKRKRGTANAIRFEYDLLGNLFDLSLSLQNGTYRPSRSVCFITMTPKMREIFAADFKDRVVHHLVVRELEKIWEPVFIYDSYASRKGKGLHHAVKRLQCFMRRISRNGNIPAYYLQLDIRSFFMNIDKDKLYSIFEKKLIRINHPDTQCLLYLLFRTIYHDCTKDFSFKGDMRMLEHLPPHKSLFKMPQGKGLPIGNLTSQFFANVYLNELDQFIKHVIKCRYYMRYVDDLLLLAGSRDQLQSWEHEIKVFLRNRLGLELKSDGLVGRLSTGVDFLGYIVRPKYMLCRNRVVNNLKAKLRCYKNELIKEQVVCGKTIMQLNMYHPLVARLHQTLASYLGHFKHANTFKLVMSVFMNYPWLNEYFFHGNGKPVERYRHKRVFRTLKQQIFFFMIRLKDTLVLFQVGKFFEMYDNDALVAGKALGFRVAVNIRGMKHSAGFPLKHKDRIVRKLIDHGYDIAVICQTGDGRYIKERRLCELYRYSTGNPKVSVTRL